MTAPRVPFAVVPSWLAMAPELSDRAVRVYVLLAHHADRDTRQAWPARSTLAELAGCSVDSIDRALRQLVKAGAVEVHPRRDGSGRSLSSVYVVRDAPPEPAADPVRSEGRTGAAPGPQGCPGEGRTGAARTRTTRTRDNPRAEGQGPTRPSLRVRYDPDEAEARFARLTGGAA